MANDVKLQNFKTEHDMRDILTELVEDRGSQRAVASELRISQAYLGDVLHGRRPVSAELARKLGFERVTVFVGKACK